MEILRQGRALRLLLLFAVVLGMALVPLAFALARIDQTRERETLEQALTTRTQDEAAALSGYFDRARALDLVIAHNPGFRDVYATGGRFGHGRAHRKAVAEAEEALDYVQRLYGSTIGEACFIDRGGAEIARVTRGTRATTEQLSPDESANPFFTPTFALGAGRV
jgi:C4-dicarboxylate-specific signal transduction histidine kinase